MNPQEIALKLTESYFNKVRLDFVMKHEFDGKTTVEAYELVFKKFFDLVTNEISENSKWK